MELKYIIDKHGNFALFSPVNAHNDMARGFYEKPISAGFCKLERGTNGGNTQAHLIFVRCYGKSTSLGLDSRKEDGGIITKKLNNLYD